MSEAIIRVFMNEKELKGKWFMVFKHLHACLLKLQIPWGLSKFNEQINCYGLTINTFVLAICFES